jgi:hypothetical protein
MGKHSKQEESVMKVYKFAFHEGVSETPPDILQGKTEKEFLDYHYQKGCFFGQENLMSHGTYKFMGWAFDFRNDGLKCFWYKQYDYIHEKWAPNVTAMRKAVYGKIDKIMEVE